MERGKKLATKFNLKSRRQALLEKDLGIFEENGAPKAFLKKIFNKALSSSEVNKSLIINRRASSLYAAAQMHDDRRAPTRRLSDESDISSRPSLSAVDTPSSSKSSAPPTADPTDLDYDGAHSHA